MGELSARHLRGDSMADVVFNGSGARKPVGTASVELMFDNGDGKIGGAYASYNEVSLQRQVARDGSSNYFINGARCRRKDITQLFLGTGLGSRSYAIIEQGMISRVIEAKPEDMRAFVEEAAGISRYKERRRETEARIAETRENLERLQDVRDEIDKQIRHLQRQAAGARRYQALKEQERRLTARAPGAAAARPRQRRASPRQRAVRERELAMQAAACRAARGRGGPREAARRSRRAQRQLSAACRARYYEIGADISRTEQSIQHTRELRERQRTDLAQAHSTLNDLARAHRARRAAARSSCAPSLRSSSRSASRRAAEGARGCGQEAAERALADWQQRWEEFTPRPGRRRTRRPGGARAHRAARESAAAAWRRRRSASPSSTRPSRRRLRHAACSS